MRKIIILVSMILLIMGCTHDNVKDNNPLIPDDNQTIKSADDVVCINSLEDKCAGPPGLDCSDFSLDGSLTMTISNNLGYQIEILNLTKYEEEEPWDCMTYCDVISAQIDVDGSGYADIGTSQPVDDGQSFRLQVRLSNIERYHDQGFDHTYRDNDTVQTQVGYFRVSLPVS